MTKPVPRRVFSRFVCDMPVEIYSPVSQAKLADARLLDVGMGGASIACDFNLKRAVPYEFRMHFGKEHLAVLGEVAWSTEHGRPPRSHRHGVAFSLTAAQETVLRSLVEKVKES